MWLLFCNKIIKRQTVWAYMYQYIVAYCSQKRKRKRGNNYVIRSKIHRLFMYGLEITCPPLLIDLPLYVTI